jgi:hypothetical protein
MLELCVDGRMRNYTVFSIIHPSATDIFLEILVHKGTERRYFRTDFCEWGFIRNLVMIMGLA